MDQGSAVNRPGAPKGLAGFVARRTLTQLAVALAVLAVIALTGSLLITGHAAREDQRQQAALSALADFGAIASKLPAEAMADASTLTEADAAYMSAFLSAFQDGPARNVTTLEETCRTGQGGAGVRFIRGAVGKPAGLPALETARARHMAGLGEGVFLIRLEAGQLCPSRGVEVIVVKRPIGSLSVIVGRVVDPSGAAWRWAVLAVVMTGALILVSGLAAAVFARRRLTNAIAEVSAVLDRAALGDLSKRAPDIALAPELTQLSLQVNSTLDRLEELLSWLRDSSDQLAHDFRTPLARASARMDRLMQTGDADERRELGEAVGRDIAEITRAMNEAMAMRDGEAWLFESVRLDTLIEAAAELYEPIAEARGISIVTDGSPVSALGVRSLLQRAVANLVDNAVKFSPDGGVVTLRAWQTETGPAFSVADQGPGISNAQPTPRGPDSHGMGLAFVRAILRRHGGHMTIDDGAPGAIVTARFTR